MSDRHKPHNGRDRSGHFKVKQTDVEDLRATPGGDDFVRDDVRLGGAVADIGPDAGGRGKHIDDLVRTNREDVDRATKGGGRKSKRSRGR
ncbi:MAG: hypothetical protein ACRENU_14290 [Gemmatimonadaceae bacterium]